MFNVEEALGKVTDFIHDEANTKTVIGDAFKLGEFECIPVIKVGMGFGSGGGEGKDPKKGAGEGGGAGAGFGIEPIGFLVSRGQDIHFVPTSNKQGLGSVLEKVPGVMEKYFDMQKDKKTADAN